MNVDCASLEVVLETFESILSHTTHGELLRELSPYIARLMDFSFLNLIIWDPRANAFRSQLLEPPSQSFEMALSNETELPVCVLEGDWPFLGRTIEETLKLHSFLPDLQDLMRRHKVQSSCSVTVTSSANAGLGVLTMGSARSNAYNETDLRLLNSLAAHLAFVYERWLQIESAKEQQRAIAREHDLSLAVREVSQAVVSELSLHHLISTVSQSIRRIAGTEYADLVIHDPVQDTFRRPAVSFGDGNSRIGEDWVQQRDDSPALVAFRTKRPFVATREKLEEDGKKFKQIAQFLAEGIQEFCCIPLISRGKVLGILNVGSMQCDRFTSPTVEMLLELAKPITIAVENALAYEQITNLKDKLLREKSYLEGEIKYDRNFEEIIGQSSALKAVLDQVQDVAESDATVLILGETGTGKELIARALHNLSTRKDRTFVKLNCAAVPTGLLESELFGHERGAFTGAISSKMGLLELANHGTIFLDEVGDIPLELQPKLLRALQEGEFSRLGSTRTLKVDFRLIAATNRNLRQMVEERQYRSDLYYRLSVFPITVPPLRERREDIPLLVKHFTQKFAARKKRTIDSIQSEAMEALVNWNWPGNVRELENLIERAVILSRGSVLNVPVKDLQESCSQLCAGSQSPDRLSRDITAELIVRTLRETNGIVSGPRGAAARLNMKRTTLLWRMNSLGISRKQVLS